MERRNWKADAVFLTVWIALSFPISHLFMYLIMKNIAWAMLLVYIALPVLAIFLVNATRRILRSWV